MNKHFDVRFSTANKATKNSPWGHLATHAMSMGYNASMFWHYNHLLGMANAMGPGYMAAYQIQTYRQEHIKHIGSLSLGCLGLIVASIVTLVENN